MPLVSVIIPFYNQGRFLVDSVGSALRQTIQDIEIILIDDGSSEDPVPILAEFESDSRLKIIRQNNGGVAKARNLGIQQSKGEFLHFLDADDWIAPNMLEELVNEFKSYPEAGLSYCDLFRVDSIGNAYDNYTIKSSRRILSGNILGSLLLGGYFPPVTVLVRAETLLDVGYFDEALDGCCDWDLWIRICASGYLAQFNHSRLAYYRLHNQSMSTDHSHMKDTARATLEKNIVLFPLQMARSLNEIKEASESIHAANIYLQKKLDQLEGSVNHDRTDLVEMDGGKIWLEKKVKELEEMMERDKKYLSELNEGGAWLENQWIAVKKENEELRATLLKLPSE